MNPIRFQGPLAEKFESFVRLRQASGRDYESQAYLLSRFDRFLVEEHFTGSRITREMTEGYLRTLAALSQRTRYNRFCVVRQVCEYLALDDPKSEVPRPLRKVDSRHAHVPYFYEAEEVQSLLEAAGRLNTTDRLYPHTARTFLGLLYSTGVRTGEALALNLQDYEPRKEALHVVEGKFRKARWLPLAPSAAQALRAYLERRTLCNAAPTAPLFLGPRGGRLTYGEIYQTFRRLLQECRIRHRPGFGPRMHDFRHTFALQRLLEWYREGLDLNAELPSLATYMGHADLRGTQVYLQATPQLIEQVDQRFRNHFLKHVHPKGVQS